MDVIAELPHGRANAADCPHVELPWGGEVRGTAVYAANDFAARFPLLGPGQATVVSRRCPEKVGPSEDAAAVIELSGRHAVLVVADGLGGHASGERASRLAIEAIAERVLPLCEFPVDQIADLMRPAILDGIEQANRHVLGIGGGAATTLAVVEINGPQARPYHVGDSAIMVIGGRGKMKLLTISHSPVGYAVQAGLISSDDALHHAERHVVTNVVGCEAMRIEMGSPLALAVRDTLVVASDGLFDNLTEGEIATQIRRGRLDHSAVGLAEQAWHRMVHIEPGLPNKPDDLTFVAYRPVGELAR